MSKKIKVVFFHPATDTFSGGPKMLYRLLTGLDDDIFEPILLTHGEDELANRLMDDNISVEIIRPNGVMEMYDERMLELPLRHKFFLAGRILQYNFDARSLLKEADIVWCEDTRAILTLLTTSALSSTPYIWNVGLGQRPDGLMNYLQLLALRFADEIFIESEEQAQRIFSSRYDSNSEKFTIFNKGIDTRVFSPRGTQEHSSSITSKSEDLAIGTAATLTPRKGLEDLIRSFGIIKDQKPSANLYIAGDTSNDIHKSYKNDLGEIVSDLGLSHSVHFLGWVDDMPTFLSEIDIFTLTSYNEGISGAVREAMAMELPVVCSDVGGMSDLITDRENGLLVTPGDEEQIAESILELSSHPDLRTSLGKEGRNTIVQNYSIDNYVSRYEEYLQRLNHKYS